MIPAGPLQFTEYPTLQRTPGGRQQERRDLACMKSEEKHGTKAAEFEMC
jgi:hypothetical protein